MRNKSKMVDGDPWIWTVDDLVSQVCRSRVLFNEAGFGPSNCPDPQVFEIPLRNHQVAGAAFLTGITDTTLRDDLGIQSLGHRQALLAVVRLLRSRSRQYKQTNTTAEPTITDPSDRKKRRINVTTISQATSAHERQHVSQTSPVDQTFAGTSNGEPKNGGEWDYLLRWENTEDDEIMGSDMDMDAEEGYESVEEGQTPDAMDVDEPVEQVKEPPSGKISNDKVVDVINDCIAELIEAWYPGKVAAEDQPVNRRAMWDKAEAEGQRLRLVEKSKDFIARYEERLDRLSYEITRSTYNHEKDVRRMCRSLEATIESLVYERWLVELYESNGNEPLNQIISDIIDLGSGSDSSDAEQELVGDTELVSATDKLSVRGNSASAHATANSSGTTMIETVRAQSDGPQSPLQRSPRPPQPLESPQSQRQESSPSQRPSQPEPQDSLQQKAFRSRPTPSQSRPPQPFQLQKSPQSQEHHQVRKSVEGLSQLPTRSQKPTQSRLSNRLSSAASKRALSHNKESPEAASISTVAKWRWEDLVQQSDRKRIIMKAIYEMSNADRELLRTRLTIVRKKNLLMEISQCIAMLLRGENKMKGVLPRDLDKILKFTKLFLSWWLADNNLHKIVDKWQLEELAQCLEEKSEDLDTFYDWVNHVLANTFSKEALAKPYAPSQAEIIVISDSDDDAPKPKLKPKPKSTPAPLRTQTQDTPPGKRTPPPRNTPVSQHSRAPRKSPIVQETAIVID